MIFIEYALIISPFFNKATKKVKKETTSRVKICIVLSEDSDNNDSDIGIDNGVDNGIDNIGEDAESDDDVDIVDDE